MGKINWGRVLAGGVVTGAVASALGGLIYVLWGKDFQAGMAALGRPIVYPTAGWPVFVLVGVALGLGIEAIWIYAAIRPRFGPGPKTAAFAGIALWLICTLSDIFFMALRMLPTVEAVAPIGASLVATVAATELGAWLYKE